MPKKRDWMPLYIGDFLRDTTHLNAAQTGAYLLLIMHYWDTGGLPNEDEKLARIARMRVEDWRHRCKKAIAPFFHHGWRHARIDRELDRSREISNKRKVAAMQKHRGNGAFAHQLHTHARARYNDIDPLTSFSETVTRSSSQNASSALEAPPQSGSPVEGSQKTKIPISAELEAVMQRKLSNGPAKA